ncbi:MAG: VWA domain-containing protein [Spirochaetota bacterium]
MRTINILLTAVMVICFITVSYAQETPSDAQFWENFKQGVVHYNKKEYMAAVDFLRRALGRKPESPRARYFLGMAYYKAGFEENAIMEFNTVLQYNPEDNLTQQLVDFLSRQQFLLQEVKKSQDYTMGGQLEGRNIGTYTLSRITGLELDDTGNIYACGFGSKMALKISPAGKLLQAFTSPMIEQGRLYDIVAAEDGSVYISDFTNDTVYKFSSTGKYLARIGGPGFDEGQFYGPTSLALDREGNLYVIDSGNTRIQKFSPQGAFLMSYGEKGGQPGQFNRPSGIAVDHSGRIFVADHGKKAIYVYDPYGNFITSLKGIALQDPWGISIAEQNKLLVADGNTIKSYDLMHSTWTQLITADSLNRVLDVKMDYLKQVYASEFEKDRIVKFLPKPDRYRNLNLILSRIDASDFPAVSYYATVYDADGLPVYGLEERNFELKIGGGEVKKIDLYYNRVRDSRLDLLFLVDKSPSMQKYSQDIEIYLRRFLNTVSSEDEMAVMGYNQNSWIECPFTRSKLRVMDAITEENYAPGDRFDTAFRQAVTYLNKEFNKKALLVITDGKIPEESFQTYSYRSSINYAANNHVPVYFLSFGGNTNQDLDLFARSTGGRFYDVYHSNEYQYLYQTINSYRPPEYLVFFNDVFDPRLSNLYVEAGIEVEFNGRAGKSKLGFIYPESP